MLEGIRVLDLSRVLAGPMAGSIFADLGAEVIKVERPGKGDETRGWGPPFAGGESAYYMSANRGKLSITLDLLKGREVLERLVRRSDIVLLNFLPQTLKKLRLTYQELSAIKPDIIWVNITGFGLTGPMAQRPGYDILIQAMSGLMSITGEEKGPPMKVGVAICDVLTAYTAVYTALAALYRREKRGAGAKIDLSLLETTLFSLVNVAYNYLIGGSVPRRYGNAHPNIVPYQLFSTLDGEIIVGVGNEDQWKRFCRAIKREELASDPRFRTNADRLKNRNLLILLLEEIFAGRTSSEWIAVLEREEIPCSEVLTVDRAFELSSVKERKLVQTISHPSAGKIKVMANPAVVDEERLPVRRHPPLLGEHTQQVLSWLGYSEEEIAAMKDEGVI